MNDTITAKIMAVAMVLTLIFAAAPATAQDDSTDEGIGDAACEPRACPNSSELQPQIGVSLGFELTDCAGTREKFTDSSTTVGGGAAKAPKTFILFAFKNYRETDLGWGWSFECTIRMTEALQAWGSGGYLREVSIVADTPNGYQRTEANCFYDGVFEKQCVTPPVIEAGEEFLVQASSDGITAGYPNRISAESIAVALNAPDGHTHVCVTSELCYTGSTPGQLINPQVVKYTPIESDVEDITWNNAATKRLNLDQIAATVSDT